MNKKGKKPGKYKILQNLKTKKVNLYDMSEKELANIYEIMRTVETLAFDENGWVIL